jgi:hypothetical protein
MNGAWVGVFGALAGTAIGAVLTQYLQRRVAAATRLHESRIDAYRGFITATMTLRKALTDRWFARDARSTIDNAAVYAARTAAWAAFFDVELLAADDRLVAAAALARDLTADIKGARNRDEVNQRAHASLEAVGRFAGSAREQVTAR